MSAQRLREAAEKIRSVAAQAGTRSTGRIDWWLGGCSELGAVIFSDEGADIGEMLNEQTGRHVVLWSPPVALAVAAWLDATANTLPGYGEVWISWQEGALAVADLILKAES